MRLETFQKVLENTTTLVNLSGEDGKTAVFLAVEEGNRDVLERLSKVGAEIDCMDKKNRTPLSYAAEQGLHETVKFLVEEQNAEVDSKVCEQLTPLHGRSVEENTALILAVRHSSITTVRQLLTSEHFTIDVNQYAKGGTALSLATELELVGIMEQLIPKADVNLRDDNELKRTPLIWAVEKGKGLSVIKLLQMGGIEVNKSNTQGRTPFSLAAEKRWVDIMQMLLKRKADPHKEDMSGHTGFWWFLRARSGRPVIRVTLGRKFPMMYRSSLPELMEVLEHLEPNRQDSAGRTWLSWAAEEELGTDKALHIVKTFISYSEGDGLHFTGREDPEGLTPLHLACFQENEEIVDALLEYAYPNPRELTGRSCLQYALDRENERIIRRLLRSISDLVDVQSSDWFCIKKQDTCWVQVYKLGDSGSGFDWKLTGNLRRDQLLS
ncbi:hypothetical protein N7445_009257 [Penicillium cf. griseofulvum]|nr:hypothetical protein N7445_009257 [Penicillium cf. griseofulvum]